MAQEDPLAHLDKVAHSLDSLIPIPGTRIRVGLDPLIGLIPGTGDILTALLSAYLVWFAIRAGVPRPILVKMLTNIAIDCTAGAVPVIGDLFDVSWRANRKNLTILRRYLAVEQNRPAPKRRWIQLIIAISFIGLMGILGALISLTVMSFLGTLRGP